MTRRMIFSAVLLFAVLGTASSTKSQTVAPTPPMGWNSWDAYGLTIDEADLQGQCQGAGGRACGLGWQYAVIDEGWYMENPFGAHLADRKYLWDGNGILIPVVSRFPSSADGAGFKPLADWVHAQGLKFGIHIVRGIPQAGGRRRICPSRDRSFTPPTRPTRLDTCPWDDGN